MGLIDRLGLGKSKEDSSENEKKSRKHQKERELQRSEIKKELEELRGFTSDNIDKFSDEFSDVRSEIKSVKEHNSEFNRKMFETLQMVERRISSVEDSFQQFQDQVEDRIEENSEKIESLEQKYADVETQEKKIQSVEDRMDSELHRLEKQKVDGKDIVHLSSRPEPSREPEPSESIDQTSMGDLTKKQRAKVKILQLLKQDMNKTQIRKQIEGEVCSRQWFYKAWDELEKQEAYISGREEALIHPEDYKKQLSKDS